MPRIRIRAPSHARRRVEGSVGEASASSVGLGPARRWFREPRWHLREYVDEEFTPCWAVKLWFAVRAGSEDLFGCVRSAMQTELHHPLRAQPAAAAARGGLRRGRRRTGIGCQLYEADLNRPPEHGGVTTAIGQGVS